MTTVEHLVTTTRALTRNQLNIWLGQAAAPDLPVFNELTVFVIKGELDRGRFDRALQAVIDGTDALRIVIDADINGPTMRIVDELPFRSNFRDLSNEPDVDDALDSWARAYVDTMLDLSRRVFDSTLVRLSPTRYAWALLQHHVASDATSMTLVYERVSDWYERLGEDDAADDLTPSYSKFSDYIDHMEAFGSSESYRQNEQFWTERLADHAPPTQFFDGRSLPPSRTGERRARHEMVLDHDRAARVRAFASQDGVRFVSPQFSLFTVFAAALSTYLYRLDGTPRRSIGVAWQNRPREFADTVGLLMEQDPFAVTLTADDTFASVIGAVQREALSVMRRLPYAPGNPGGRHYDVALNVVTVSVGDFAGMPTQPRWFRPSHGEGSLLLQVHDIGGEGTLALGFDFNAELFSPDQRARAIEQFLCVLDRCTSGAAHPIGDFELLPEAERERIAQWNATTYNFPVDATVIDLFEAQVVRRPDAPALAQEGRTVTYAELNNRADSLAAALRAQGARPGSCVGVCLDRSLDLVIGVLAVMKAGAAYVPLDPAFPPDRLAYMLADSGASIVLTQRELMGTVDPGTCSVLLCDAVPTAEPADAPVASVAGVSVSDGLAYVLYTSGSTGRPKGVEISHRALTNFLCSMAEVPGCSADDVLVAVTTLSFDIAGLELYLPLITGGRIELASRAVTVDGHRLADLLASSGATIMQATPATWRMLIDAGWTGSPALKVLCGGEALPVDLASQLLDRVGELWNMYGPTETTIWSSLDRVERDQQITIGRPIANTEFYVVDERLRLVPIGVPGELLIGGTGLADGYRDRPELTQRQFIAHPFSDDPTARVYRTGDKVRYRDDGKLVHLGRLDHQVKVRGFRIELGEIETVLDRHPDIEASVVIARDDGAEAYLAGYVITHPDSPPTVGDLRRHLQQSLPDYMVPAVFVTLDEFPLTPNGKIDRRALPAPPDDRPTLDRDYTAPRTPTEHALVTIWRDLLGIEQIGTNDDFFELGGHSLLALRMIARIHSDLDADIALATLFEQSTIHSIAARVDVQRLAEGAAPDHVTEQIRLIWSRLLGRGDLSDVDDFVALHGGPDAHEAAAAMIAEVRHVLAPFAEGLSVTEFLEQPTLRSLTDTIVRRIRQESDSLVVPLQPDGDRKPLFLVHAGGGYVFFYRALATSLGADVPTYGIRAATDRDTSMEPFWEADSIEALASLYIREMKSVQPDGPYSLGGACAGAVIAFEMARQLLQQGEQLTGPIIAFDAVIANNAQLAESDRDALALYSLYRDPTLQVHVRRRLRLLLREASAQGAIRGGGHLARTLGGAAARIVGRRLNRPGASPQGPARDNRLADADAQAQLTKMQATLDRAVHLVTRYRPCPVEAALLFFEAEESGPFARAWKGLALLGTTVHRRPGGHLDMLEHPLVDDVARLVRASLLDGDR